jgi:uncharacterized protein
MKKTHILSLCFSLLSFLPGCASADNASTQKTPADAPPAVVDPWPARKALFDYDAKAPLSDKLTNTQESFVSVTKSYTIKGAQGDSVPVLLILPGEASATNKVPGVVVLHGKGGRIEEMLIVGQFLATRGYASVIPEIVGHGARRTAGAPNLFGGEANPLRDGIIESVQDIRRAVDLLTQQPEVDANRIGLTGYSLGAILGTMVTAVEPRIQTSVLVVGGGDWKTILGQSQERDAAARRAQGTVNPDDFKKLEDVDPVNFAAHIAPRPLLFINGKQDNIIPEAAAKALFDAAKEPKQQIWLNAGHFLPPTETGRLTIEWFDEKLKNVATETKTETATEKAA